MTEPLLTIDEVSKITRVPVKSLREYRAIGTGPRSAKLGKRIVYRRADVEAWIEEAFAAA